MTNSNRGVQITAQIPVFTSVTARARAALMRTQAKMILASAVLAFEELEPEQRQAYLTAAQEQFNRARAELK